MAWSASLYGIVSHAILSPAALRCMISRRIKNSMASIWPAALRCILLSCYLNAEIINGVACASHPSQEKISREAPRSTSGPISGLWGAFPQPACQKKPSGEAPFSMGQKLEFGTPADFCEECTTCKFASVIMIFFAALAVRPAFREGTRSQKMLLFFQKNSIFEILSTDQKPR